MSLLEKKQTADIVFLYPKTGLDVGGHTVAPPHSILAVAAPVREAGYSVKIIDMRRDDNWRETVRQNIGSNTLCVGISTMTGTQLYFALLMAQESRELTKGKIPLVWGGPHPTILPEQTASHPLVDVVVYGEGEITFLELVRAIEHKQPWSAIKGLAYKEGREVIVTPPRPLLEMETLLPVPWELINVEDYICEDNYFLKNSPRTLDIGQTSRGCPHRCGFCCSSSILEKKWRAMSVKKSLERIMEPVRRFGLTGVWIRDDEFYVNNNRAFSICERVISEKEHIQWYATGSRVDDFNRFSDDQIKLIKLSGGRITKFGAESGSNRILDLIHKGFHVEDTLKANLRCKKHGIIPAYSLVVGFPTETFDEINQTIDFGFRLKKENPEAQLETFPTYTPFPCTPMWELALAHGLQPPDRLEGWVNWIMDEYDLEGKRVPWYTRRERKWIGNINYLSILGNAAKNVGSGIQHSGLRALFLGVLTPLQKYYSFRLRHKYYKRVPELALARYLRKKIFYRNEHNIR
jgi:anaerobic magnesium-protoporphyrin IX monomethyl ester cyclase